MASAPASERAARRRLGGPAAHFLLLGAALFALHRWLVDPSPALVVRLRAADVRALEDDFERRTGHRPTDDERTAAIEAEIDDRLLVEEAIARGVHRDDAIVQRRLIANQRFLAPDESVPDGVLLERAYADRMHRSDVLVRRRLIERRRLEIAAIARGTPPTPDELDAYHRAHAERFARPARVRVSQVFLSRDRRRDALQTDAARLGARLRDDSISPEVAETLSDALPVRMPSRLVPEERLGRRFGAAFAAALAESPVGRWSGPIASPFGLHFVYVHERRPPEQPALEDVVLRVREALLRDRERAALRAHLDTLRAAARVELDLEVENSNGTETARAGE